MKAKDVRQFMADGDYKAALRGAKDFHIGVSKDQRSVMCRAYECFNFPAFYIQLGINIETAKAEGIKVLEQLYGHQ
jgi:hypothetical protein